MAAENITERRAYVRKYLRRNGRLFPGDAARIGRMFRISAAIISKDVLVVRRAKNLGPMYPTAETRWYVFNRDGNRCQYCGDAAADLIAEHVIPTRRGGVGKSWNMVAACIPCNARKRSDVWVPMNIDYLFAERSEWARRIMKLATRNFSPTERLSHPYPDGMRPPRPQMGTGPRKPSTIPT